VKDYYTKQCWDWQFKNWPYSNYDMCTFDEAIARCLKTKENYGLTGRSLDLCIIRKSYSKIIQTIPLKEALRIQKLNNL
jgi:hypothetical protein